MADPSNRALDDSSCPHTRSQSRVLSTGSVAGLDDPPRRPSSAHECPPGAFDSSFVELSPPALPATPFQFEAVLTTAPTTVRPVRTRRQDPEPSRHEPSRFDDNDDGDEGPRISRLGQDYTIEAEEEKRRTLELQIRLEELRRSSNQPTDTSPTTRSPTWDPDLGNKLGYKIYDPDSRIGKAISQFKEEVRHVTKPNALTGTSNYIMWSASMKSKLVDAQCIEKRQERDPVQEPEWAPFWNARNRWIYAFISSSLSANVRPRYVKFDEGRVAYTFWRAIEEEYSIPKTQLRREAILEFTSLGGTQAINVHAFFDKFRAAIINLEMLDVMPLKAWVFDIFYSSLPNIWRNYVQKKVDEAQISKSTSVVLDVHQITEEIRSRLDPPKDKKPANTAGTATNAAQADSASADSSNETSNSARGGRSGAGVVAPVVEVGAPAIHPPAPNAKELIAALVGSQIPTVPPMIGRPRTQRG
ncbi:hypothetical protein ACJ73_03453 [Blastomyces percursus]|uniref:Uncharacterized protein n=1 Tax=Blastomyces percursus TaxID=1658174 RepID=A0A1J9Q9P8_9EURO|nr:hypothetical protein ACJ73_03453 [Blastomyces percursus]